MLFNWEERRDQRVLVILTALSFLLLTVAIITVYGSPMEGYELSVYASTPAIFWIAILVCLMTGMFLFHVHHGTGNRLWVVGLFEIIQANFVLISLYLYKGFIHIERTDSMSYVGSAWCGGVSLPPVVMNSYLVLSLLEETAYTNTWAATGKFYPADFYSLSVSSSVNTIYDNIGLTVYARSAP